jgi:hypothetical protein
MRPRALAANGRPQHLLAISRPIAASASSSFLASKPLVRFIISQHVSWLNGCSWYGSNRNMSVAFMINYFLVEDNVFINNKAVLMTAFVNLKIKPLLLAYLTLQVE